MFIFGETKTVKLKIMSHIEQVKRNELNSLKGQLTYAVDCITNRSSEMMPFEIKEYNNMISDLTAEIKFLENHIKSVF